MRVCFSVLVGVFTLVGVAQAARPRPNFLVILTDDQTYRAIGYNNPEVLTPAMDRLAAEGVIFTHAYAASPICAASRASLMTGLFPQQHGTISLNNSRFLPNLKKGLYKTLPSYLHAAGYVTTLCGKSHLGEPPSYGFTEGKEQFDVYDREPLDTATTFLAARGKDHQSFLLWFAARQPHVPLLPDKQWLDLYSAPPRIAPNFLKSPPQESIYNQGRPGEHYYRDSAYIKNYKNLPAGPPRSKEVIEDFTRAYYATISHLDHQVGELLAQLKNAGLDKNTTIVFLSDNGYFLGNHGLGNKITMHEESVRVPMFVYSPGLTAKGARCDELVSGVDVLPTILELAGAERPARLSGQSLVPQLRDPKQHLRDYVASECVGVGGKLGEGHRMVRTKRWKYVLTDINEESLFDESSDPYELKNLASDASHRETLQAMRQSMRSWMDSVHDGHARPPGN